MSATVTRVSISFIQPLVRELDVDGQLVIVRTADMDQILALVGHTEPLQAELASAPAAVFEAINGFELLGAEKAQLMGWLLGLVARHREAVKAIVAICTRQEPSYIGALLPDRFMALLLLSVEVNADFFSRMLPQLAGLADQLQLPGRAPQAAAAAAAAAATATAPASTGQPPSSN